MPAFFYQQPSHPFWDFVADLGGQAPPPHPFFAGPPPAPPFPGEEGFGPWAWGPRRHWHRGPPPPGPHHHPHHHRRGGPGHAEAEGTDANGAAARNATRDATEPPAYKASSDTLRGDEKSTAADPDTSVPNGKAKAKEQENEKPKDCPCDMSGFRGPWGARGGRHCGGPGARGFRGARGGPWGPRHHGGREGLQQFMAGPWGAMINDLVESFTGERTGDDFKPAVDVFNTASAYVVHASLPGAKKEDLAVTYDAKAYSLTISGVAYRPGVDEELSNALAQGERQVGPFRRTVTLGSREQPATVDTEGITAKLEDGVLIVVLPKVVENAPSKVELEQQQQQPEVETPHESYEEKVVENTTPSVTVQGVEDHDDEPEEREPEHEHEYDEEGDEKRSSLSVTVEDAEDEDFVDVKKVDVE